MKNESCLRWDSNPRHSVLQTDALPTELLRQMYKNIILCIVVIEFMLN